MQKTLSLLLVRPSRERVRKKSTVLRSPLQMTQAPKPGAMPRKPCPGSCGPRIRSTAFDRCVCPGSSGDGRSQCEAHRRPLAGRTTSVRAKHNLSFDISAHNYPEHVKKLARTGRHREIPAPRGGSVGQPPSRGESLGFRRPSVFCFLDLLSPRKCSSGFLRVKN